MPVAFFDVDHTLVKGSTAFHCAAVMRERGLVSAPMMLRVAIAHLQHKAGLLDYEDAYARGVLLFSGMPLDELSSVLRECFDRYVRPSLYTEGLDLLERHRRAGDRVVLLSASSVYLLELFREVAPVDDILAFRQRARDGRLVNEYDRPICYGANKLPIAREYATRHGVSLSDCHFYTDSSTDLPLLRAVGHPFAVNPDPRLLIEAWLRGWPVLRFGQTVGQGLPPTPGQGAPRG